jgi:aminoglycoside phosphotransferase (APT) family kinase protein
VSAARLHADQVDVDEPLVERLLAAQLPHLARLRLRRFPSGGTENAVFRLGDDLAVRAPLTPGAVTGLVKEVRWLPQLAPRLTLPVPRVVATGRATADYPFPWAVVRWLDGDDALARPLTDLPDAAAQLARLVAELRAIPVPAEAVPGSEGFERGGPLSDRAAYVQEWLPRCEGLMDVAAVRRVWDDALAAPAWNGPPVWLHADLHQGNVLVRDGRLAGVLDFGAVCTGDPAYDVTAGYHLLDRGSRATFVSMVDADDATVARARGLVVSSAVAAIPYYLRSNPAMIAIARAGLASVLDDDPA